MESHGQAEPAGKSRTKVECVGEETIRQGNNGQRLMKSERVIRPVSLPGTLGFEKFLFKGNSLRKLTVLTSLSLFLHLQNEDDSIHLIGWFEEKGDNECPTWCLAINRELFCHHCL